MAELKGARVLVAGAGALGSVIALELLQSGAQVVLADPAPPGDNASGVAAGMLAPAMEASTEAPDQFPLLCAARDAWPALLARLQAPHMLDRSGGLWLQSGREGKTRIQALAQIDGGAEAVSAAQAAALAPGLAGDFQGVFLPGEWRIDPQPVLEVLRAALIQAGAQIIQARLAAAGEGWALLDTGERIAVQRTIFAGGHPATAALGLAPELALLSPVKGQILRLAASGLRTGPIVRTSDVYVAPGAAGPAAGATMEPGRDDRSIDPQVMARLHAAAARLFPALARAGGQGLAGVRSTTQDGLPLVGHSRAAGVLLATGARRNGWLLAPLIGTIVAAYVAGRDPGPWAAALDPSRFGDRT